MREKRTIKLEKPLITPEGELWEIVIREPSFDEYLAFGDPYQVAYTTDGSPFAVEQVEVIKNYFRICVVEPKNHDILQQGSARLARRVKQELLSFFRPEEEEDEASETSPTKSPSPDSDPTASTTSAS